MPTTVVKSIGATARDYSTLQAWEDACPANLVTADQIWRGECYNDSEFVYSAGGSALAISGETVDSTRYIELTAATGQSFQDNASVRTNPLKYDASKGVGIRSTTGYNAIIDGGNKKYTRLSRLQIKHAGTGGLITNIADGSVVKDILGHVATGNPIAITTGTMINFFCFTTGATGGKVITNWGGNLIVGCTLIRSTDQTSSQTAFTNNQPAYVDTLKDSACFGYATATSSGFSSSSANNATDLASGLPGSNNQHSVTFSSTTPFTNSTVASQNSIPVAATALAANGVLDSTNAPNDITGYARANPPTIGCWELTAAAGLSMAIVMHHRKLMAVN